jgi:hypothetical protein
MIDIGTVKLDQLDQEIVDAVQPNIDQGPWIAGGSVMCWTRPQLNWDYDVDVFFRDDQQYNQVKQRLDQAGLASVHSSEMAITYQYCTEWSSRGRRVQLVKLLEPSVHQLLNHFDISACRVVSDGQRAWALDAECWRDLTCQQLQFLRLIPETAVRRFLKYRARGFRATQDTVRQIQNLPELCVNFAGNNDAYDHV